eukprot:NODE_58_length_28395_cov_1.465720.p17 type:complete len:219 gc:universal NODE_58_length_28395_cov_1.465720:23264-23920(+)
MLSSIVQNICNCFGTAKVQETKLITQQTEAHVDQKQIIRSQQLLLPSATSNKKTLIIDLDETLVHASFSPIDNPDIIVEVELDKITHQVYVLLRPYAREFIIEMAKLYELVIFTASLSKYADPVVDFIDTMQLINYRLYRHHCTYHNGIYVKDLAQLNRSLEKVIIIDNSPASYAFHPSNAIGVTSWFSDKSDTELKQLTTLLKDLSNVNDVRTILKK